ncbi:Chaperone protein dnaJ 11, chloroplastic [Linum perenne]
MLSICISPSAVHASLYSTPSSSFTAPSSLAIKASVCRRLKVKASVAADAIPIQQNSTLTLYAILKVERTASLKEIKSAYRKLAKVVHPDRTNDGGRHFIEIHSAYETLSDPQSREMYDLSLGFRLPIGCCSGRFIRTQRWETDQCF